MRERGRSAQDQPNSLSGDDQRELDETDSSPDRATAATPNAAVGASDAAGLAAERTLIARGGDSYVRIRVPRTPRVQTLRWEGAEGTLAAPGVEALGRLDVPPPGSNGATAPNPRPGACDDIVLPGLGSRQVVAGSRLGGLYVRRRLGNRPGFHTVGADTVEAQESVLTPGSALGRALDATRRVVFGRRLKSAEEVHQRLTRVKALAVLSSDAISSVAYATEASLGILIAAGLGALRFNLPIAACIVILMIAVGFSYRQTIHAYPQGGGSYIVARDNLGDLPGLVAAGALLIDYVLTVSVSVAAGIGALVSAVPGLTPYSVWMGVGCVAIITLVNLRGIRESGSIFAAPTYLFIGSFLLMIVAGVVRAALSPGGLITAAAPVRAPASLGWSPAPLGIVLILTAFASGCSAMTGVEAISNGIPAFKRPESRNAARTLEWMIAILVTLYLGVTYIAWRFGIEPNSAQNPTLDSQVAHLVFAGPFAWFYYVVQIATLLILVLAANTSFADFPRLSSILARDGFLPHQFAYRGDRLAFSTGIIALAILSMVLLVAFQGSTDALINLYAVGVFTAFTLSQSGMVVRWLRLREQAGPAWRRSLAINLIGAIATGLVDAVIVFSKFDRGAWIVVILVPICVLLFRGIARHYQRTGKLLTAVSSVSTEALRHATHTMVVPIAALNRPALRGLAYALSLTPNVIAVHISTDPREESTLREEWDHWIARASGGVAVGTRAARVRGASEPTPYVSAMPHLVIIESPYRSLVKPLVAYIDALRDANHDAAISVILPEFVPAHWWERLLHNETALRLKFRLYSDPGVAVINIPYHIPRGYRDDEA